MLIGRPNKLENLNVISDALSLSQLGEQELNLHSPREHLFYVISSESKVEKQSVK